MRKRVERKSRKKSGEYNKGRKRERKAAERGRKKETRRRKGMEIRKEGMGKGGGRN